MKTRFKIFIDILINGVKRLKLKPEKLDKDLVDQIPDAINFFNDYLYDFSDDLKDCNEHYENLYKTLPKDIPFYYKVERYTSKDGVVGPSFCTPLGVGQNETEALANFRIDNWIGGTISRQRPDLSTLDGHLVKASFDGDTLVFEPIEGMFIERIRLGNILARKIQKKMVLDLPIDDTPLPESLELSKFWSDVSEKYSTTLEKKNAKKVIDDLNAEFAKAEKKFYQGVQTYREYKERLKSIQQSSSIIGFILQGASILNDVYSSSKYSEQMNSQTKKIDTLTKEISKVRRQTEEHRQKANTTIINIYKTYRHYKVPIDNLPEIKEEEPILIPSELG